MEVAVVLAEKEPFSPEVGGALSTWVKEVYGQMSSIKPIVFSPRTKCIFSGFKVIQLPVNTFSLIGRILPSKKLSIYVKSNIYPLIIALYCRARGIGIFHIHNRPSYVLIIRRVCPKAKIILHMQNDHLITSPLKIAKHAIEQADHIISTSKYIERGISDLAAKLNVKSPRYTVIYNGANANNFSISSKSNIMKKHLAPKVLFSGRLVPEKGVEQLIKAMLKVLEVVPNAQLIIIGGHHFGNNKDTAYIQKLRYLASKAKDKIILKGFLPHYELPTFYNDAAVFVCPSIWNDPFPLVILEGMASGLPIVGSKKGGIPEAIDESVGFLVDPNNIDEMSDKIIYLLNNASAAVAMGMRARSKFQEYFTWEIISKQTEELLLEYSSK